MKNIHDMIYDVRLEWEYSRFKNLFSRTSGLLPHEHEMSPDSRRSLDDLNRKRQGLQKSISETFAPFKDVCRDCGGVCCYGHGSFYRAIDYWLQRRNGNAPLPSHAGEREVRITPQRLYSILCRFLVTSGGSYDYIKENMKDKEKSPCGFLTVSGCRLDVSNRPVLCIVWVCPSLRKATNLRSRMRYIELVTQLYIICRRTADVIRTEHKAIRGNGRGSGK